MNWSHMRKILFVIFLSLLGVFGYGQCDDLEVNAGSDVKYCPEERLMIIDATISSNFVRHYWQPENRVLDPNSLVTEVVGPGTYTLIGSAWDYNNNLIDNWDFSQGNTGFTSQYSYVPPTGPFDNFGMYGVDSDPVPYSPTGPGSYRNCTPLVGDNMLIARGANLAGLSAWCKNIAVEQNTDYHFIFYSANIGTSHSAQFTVIINNNSYTGLDNAGFNCEWTRHEVFWFSGAQTSAQICINNIHRNLPYKNYANAFVLDNMQLYKTCKKEDQVTIGRIDMPLDGEDEYLAPCESYIQNLPLTEFPTEPFYEVAWRTSDGKILNTLQNPPYTATVEGPGEYIVSLTYDDGEYSCFEEQVINVYDEPITFEAFPEEIISLDCQNSKALIEAINSKSDFDYHWFTENGDISGDSTGTQVFAGSQGIYFLVETDPSSGCADTTEIEILNQDDVPESRITGGGHLNCAQSDEINISGVGSYIGPDDDFQWNSPDGNFSSSTDDLNVSIDAEGAYYLIITDSITGCADTAVVNVTADFSYPQFTLPEDINMTCDQEESDRIIVVRSANENDVGYEWHTPTGIYQNDSMTIDQEGMYIVIAVDSSSRCTTADTILVEDLRNIPDFSIASPGELNCNNSFVEIQASKNGNSDPLIRWWSQQGNITSPTDGVAQIEVDQPGWYFLQVIDSISNCEMTDSVLIEENYDLPSLSATDSLVLTCQENELTLEGQTNFDFPGLTWGWLDDNHRLIGQNEQSIEIESDGNYFFFIFNENNGCSDTVQTIVVPDENIPLLEVETPDKLTCERTSIVLSASGSSSSGQNDLDFEWSTSNGEIDGSSTGNNIRVTRGGVYSVRVVDAANGCENEKLIEVEWDTVSPIFSISNEAKITCTNSEIQLYPSEDFNPEYIYEWSTQDGNINSSSDQYEIEITEPGEYQLLVTNISNGCSSIRTVEVAEDRELPVISVAEPGVITCLQTEIELNAFGSDNGADFNINWSTNDGNFSDVINPLNPTVNAPGSYILTIENITNQCISRFTVEVLADTISPIIQLEDPETIACYNEEVQLISEIINGGENINVNWYTTQGNILSNSNNLSITVDQPGQYEIQVVNQDNGCTNRSAVEVPYDPERPRDFDLDLRTAECPDDISSVSILNIEGGYAPYTILLNNQLFSFDQDLEIDPGFYEIEILDSNNCSITQEFEVEAPDPLDIYVPENIEIELGEHLELSPQISFDRAKIERIQWLPEESVDCAHCLRTRFIGTESTDLELWIYTRDGCAAMGRASINVFINKDIYAPNAFSPNFDGNNDFFTIYSSQRKLTKVSYLMIFDRWGDKVFEKNDFPPNIETEGWDGRFNDRPLNPAVFVFVAEVEFLDGSTKVISGDLTLVK